MSRHHTGGSERHKFTTDIIVLGTKPTNKYNTYCVCKACDEILGQEETLKNPITNKKNIVRNHLKNCEHFHAKRGSEEAVRSYCNKTDDEDLASQTSRKHQNSDILALSNRILDAEQNNFIKSHEQKLEGDGIGVTLAFDGWKNILKQNIFGSLFILSNGEVQVWEAIDISSEREWMIDIISKIEKMISNTSIIGAKLLAIVSDSAPAYATARKKKLESKLDAYCNLATTFESPFDSLIDDSNNEESDELYLLQNITSILLNDNFWQSITRLSSLLLPYCGALNNLQSDTAHLYNVLQAFGRILKMWQEHLDHDLAQRMIRRLEQRWSQ
ncbi:10276_t:CDS:2 [Cetraspora pellucida]|uniref:10276_t:CDS:1 n=1 Tax=Cetraspora pellucida TaxID=1433469 RepID=A0ACA9KL05_9GLOM|nr:10276_t:CDS:2 [Cetraspora pellucida]